MANYTYEDVVPSLIPNTIMQKKLADGVHQVYAIQAIDGYVLHDKTRDYEDINPDTNEWIPKRGYTTARSTCQAAYDFAPSQITIDDGTVVTAYGAREYFAIPANAVPSDQIFGGGGTVKPEIM